MATGSQLARWIKVLTRCRIQTAPSSAGKPLRPSLRPAPGMTPPCHRASDRQPQTEQVRSGFGWLGMKSTWLKRVCFTQTAPSSAGASAGSTTVLGNSEWTGSSALPPTAPTSKDVPTFPLLQELLTTLLPASSDPAGGLTRGDVTAGETTNNPLAVTQKPGQTTSKHQDQPAPSEPASVTQSANTDETSSYQAGRKAFRALGCQARRPETSLQLWLLCSRVLEEEFFPTRLCSWKIKYRLFDEERSPRPLEGCFFAHLVSIPNVFVSLR